MKRVVIAGSICAAVASLILLGQTNEPKSLNDFREICDVETMSACESVGWYNNDGNCVSNDAGTYFCATDTWYHITDCKQ